MAPVKPSPGQIDAQGIPPMLSPPSPPPPPPSPPEERSSGAQVSGTCAAVGREARGADNELNPAPEGRVIGAGRLHFHTAPRTNCRSRNRFIIPGDAVVARRRHGDWLLIDYVSRDGVTHSAWVDAARIDLTEAAVKR